MPIQSPITRLLFTAALLIANHHPAAAAEPGKTHVVAHRGLLMHAPENTLSNFRACLELRLGFELDVERTRDGHLVCIHDATVDRTTDGRGAVADMTLDQIRQLDAGRWFDPRFAGERVPTIDEVFQLIAEQPREVLIAVDIKAEGVERDLVALATQHGITDRLLFIGRTISDAALRTRIRELSPDVVTAAVANNPAEFVGALQSASVVYFRYLPSPQEMAAVRQAGKGSFIAGTLVAGNQPENWQRASELGIDAVLTDYPLELAAMLRQMQRRER